MAKRPHSPPQRGSGLRMGRRAPTLFGMEIAPTRPRRRRQPPATAQPTAARQPATETEAAAAKRQQGLALLMVMFLLVMASTITIDLQFDSRVQLQLAANSRNTLQAEYLARSAIQFTHLLLSFDHNFQRMKNNPQLKALINSPMIPPQVKIVLNRLQLWRIIPIDCGLLKQVFGGAFGDAKKEKKRDGDDDADADKGKQGAGKEGRLYPFGDFQGNCKATMADESAKINLNKATTLKDAQELTRQLTNLFANKKYDPLFENARADGTHVTRTDQVAAFIDWVDSNTQVANEPGTSEDSKYRYQEKGYINKNSYFDSLDEIRLVYGVDDIFWREFAKMFTVYGRGSININEARQEVLAAIIMTYGKPTPPLSAAVFLQPEFQQFMAALISYRSYIGFPSLTEFRNFLKTPTVLDPQLFPSAATQGAQIQQGSLPTFTLNLRGQDYKFKTNADTFRVTAEGIVGTVRRRISAVIYVEPRGARVVQYWRLH